LLLLYYFLSGVVQRKFGVKIATRFGMLHLALGFVVFALIAVFIGSPGIAVGALGAAKILFVFALVFWLLFFMIARKAV
jgi:uncharacterized membrane protein YtjA (UPF0391 family)